MSDTYKEKAKQYDAMIEAKNKDGQLDKYIEEQNAANAERMDTLMKNTAEVGSKLQAGMGKMKYIFAFYHKNLTITYFHILYLSYYIFISDEKQAKFDEGVKVAKQKLESSLAKAFDAANQEVKK